MLLASCSHRSAQACTPHAESGILHKGIGCALITVSYFQYSLYFIQVNHY
jgi:hypothetical protein